MDNFNLGDFLNTVGGAYTTYNANDIANAEAQAKLIAAQNAAAETNATAASQARQDNLRKNIRIGGFALLGVLIVIWIFQKFLK
jgi:hypothetical protein